MPIAQEQTRYFSRSVLIAIGLSLAIHASAEQADRNKPINIEFDVATLDDSKRVQTLEGNVILTQGTMRLAAGRMVIKQDEAGLMTAQAFGVPGGQVAFKQKREGSADFMEGFADRAEFDDKADTLKLFSRARLKNAGDELNGEYIYYNSATEVFQVRNGIPDTTGKSVAASGSSRPSITIQPKTREEKPKLSPPAKTN